MVLKLHLEKFYFRVDWDFLDLALARIVLDLGGEVGSRVVYLQLTFSLLVNGTVSGFFSSSRDLHRDDHYHLFFLLLLLML